MKEKTLKFLAPILLVLGFLTYLTFFLPESLKPENQRPLEAKGAVRFPFFIFSTHGILVMFMAQHQYSIVLKQNIF